MNHASFFDLLDSMDYEVNQMDSSWTERTIIRFWRLAAHIQDEYEQELFDGHKWQKYWDTMRQEFGESTMAVFNSYLHDANKCSIEQVIKRVQDSGYLDTLISPSCWDDIWWIVWSLLWYLQYASKEEREELITCLGDYRLWENSKKISKLLRSIPSTLKLKM